MERFRLHCVVSQPAEVPTRGDVPSKGIPFEVSAANLTAVVTSFDGPDSAELSKRELVKSLLKHQRIVEKSMRSHRAVLPFRFRTNLERLEDVRTFLIENAAKLKELLVTFQERMELEIAATWDLQRVLDSVGQEDEIVEAKRVIIQRGAVSEEDRVHVGSLVRSHLERRRQIYSARVLERLADVVESVARNELLSDELVFNLACLVSAPRQTDLEQRIADLDEEWRGSLTFRLIGPLPPYSFCTLEVRRVSVEQLERACRALELKDRVTSEDTHRAYRKAAAQIRTTIAKTPDDREAEMKRIRRAEALILDYCHARGAFSRSALKQDAPSGTSRYALLVDVQARHGEAVSPDQFGGGHLANWPPLLGVSVGGVSREQVRSPISSVQP